MARDDKNLAESIGLTEIDTATAIDYISLDILRSMYRYKKKGAELSTEEKGLNQKIEKVYEEWTGSKWLNDGDKNLSTLLMGPPGQGKTTAFKEAAKKVAEAMDMDYCENPPDDARTPTLKDFWFVSMEFSGENSAVTIGGIPAKVQDNDGIEYMTRLVNKRLAYLSSAGGGLLLLDDFPNASPNVQNVALSLTDEKRFQGLNLLNSYVGLTGNLGALDGTHTTRLSSALRGRTVTFFTKDDPINFRDRVQQKFRDSIGDGGVIGFLQRNEECFFQMPQTKLVGGYPSPRTWDHFILAVRRAIKDNGGRNRGEIKALQKISDMAKSILGLEIGLKFHSYFYSMMQGADPIARQLIIDGKFDEKAFKERFKDGYSQEGQQFAWQFATAVCDYAVHRLVEAKNWNLDVEKNKELKETVGRLAEGILAVNPDIFAFAIDHFKAKLANQVEEWMQPSEGRRSLTTDVKKVIARIISENKNFSNEHKDLLVRTMSDSDKYDIATRRRSRRS